MWHNILIDNTDDHEKNHSLLAIHPFNNGRLQLAPAYDVLPTNSGQGYQEFICGAYGRDSTLENAMSQCAAFGLQPAEAAEDVVRVIEVVNTWRTHFAAVGVTQQDINSLAQQIDADCLQDQRIRFNPKTYTNALNKKARKSPFA